MKITAIEAVVCHARMRNWVFVKVVTDQSGLFGWGEATLEWHTRSIVGAIEDLAQLVVGEDPTRVEHLWQMMWRQHFWHGSGVVRSTAIAGIDVALWDIVGKVHGVPCHRLWGGPVRDYIRLYCHLGGGNLEQFLRNTRGQRKAICRSGDRRRWRMVFQRSNRWRFLPRCRSRGRSRSKAADACVAAMRQAVGDDIDIMVDCHARPSPAMGMQFAKTLDPYGLYFLEEPCWPENLSSLAAINAAVTTPIATGERLTNLAAFRDLFAVRGCEICQLDVTHCGGFSEARRIAALADAHRIALAPHNPQGPVSTAASLEFGFSQPSYVICESVHEDVPWRADVVEEGFEIDPLTRTVTPNAKPGLGISINEEEVRKHPFQQEVPQRVFYRDGAVGDW